MARRVVFTLAFLSTVSTIGSSGAFQFTPETNCLKRNIHIHFSGILQLYWFDLWNESLQSVTKFIQIVISSPFTLVTSGTKTCAINRITLCSSVPLTVTRLLTPLPVERCWTWYITVRQIPAGFTLTLTREGMTTSEDNKYRGYFSGQVVFRLGIDVSLLKSRAGMRISADLGKKPWI